MVRQLVAQRLDHLRRRGLLHKDEVPGGAVIDVLSPVNTPVSDSSVVIAETSPTCGPQSPLPTAWGLNPWPSRCMLVLHRTEGKARRCLGEVVLAPDRAAAAFPFIVLFGALVGVLPPLAPGRAAADLRRHLIALQHDCPRLRDADPPPIHIPKLVGLIGAQHAQHSI